MRLGHVAPSTDGISFNAIVVINRAVSVQTGKLTSWTWEDTLLASTGKNVIRLEGSVAGIAKSEDSGNYSGG